MWKKAWNTVVQAITAVEQSEGGAEMSTLPSPHSHLIFHTAGTAFSECAPQFPNKITHTALWLRLPTSSHSCLLFVFDLLIPSFKIHSFLGVPFVPGSCWETLRRKGHSPSRRRAHGSWPMPTCNQIIGNTWSIRIWSRDSPLRGCNCVGGSMCWLYREAEPDVSSDTPPCGCWILASTKTCLILYFLLV